MDNQDDVALNTAMALRQGEHGQGDVGMPGAPGPDLVVIQPGLALVSADGGLHWSTAITRTTQINPQAPAAAFLGFEDPAAGRWISDERDIWTTRDGGLHWLRQAFP